MLSEKFYYFLVGGILCRRARPPDSAVRLSLLFITGKFYRFKMPTHPHTNMAKAALNMMTRTAALDYKKVSKRPLIDKVVCWGTDISLTRPPPISMLVGHLHECGGHWLDQRREPTCGGGPYRLGAQFSDANRRGRK